MSSLEMGEPLRMASSARERSSVDPGMNVSRELLAMNLFRSGSASM